MKKFFVLALLFILPLVAYLFFASGVNNFGRLPILTEGISSLPTVKDIHENPVSLENKITVLGFFGKHPEKMKGNAFNVNWVIYKPYHEFNDFQFVFLVDEQSREEAKDLYDEMSRTVDMQDWYFVLVDESITKKLFNSLNTDLSLDENLSTPHVFIIDKNSNLRGRDDNPNPKGSEKVMYGYNTTKVGELMNEMEDDIKVILAEYRLELKKYKKEIQTQ